MRWTPWLLLLCASGALAAETPAQLRYACHAHQSEFSIAAGPTDAGNAGIPWSSLIRFGPQKNDQGEPLRTGSRTRTASCGKLTLRFQGAYLQADPQAGAAFPLLEIRLGRRVLLRRSAIAVCDTRDPVATRLGACASRWAVSVKTREFLKKAIKVTVQRQIRDAGGALRETTHTSTERY